MVLNMVFPKNMLVISKLNFQSLSSLSRSSPLELTFFNAAIWSSYSWSRWDQMETKVVVGDIVLWKTIRPQTCSWYPWFFWPSLQGQGVLFLLQAIFCGPSEAQSSCVFLMAKIEGMPHHLSPHEMTCHLQPPCPPPSLFSPLPALYQPLNLQQSSPGS